MTQIRPLTQPTHRRPGELGVHSLDHFNFSVPDARAGPEVLCDLRPRPAGGGRPAQPPHPRPPASLGLGRRGAAQAAAVHLVRRVRGRPAALPRAARRAADRAHRSAARRAVERALVPRSRRHPDRDPRGGEVVAEREIVAREHLVLRGRRRRTELQHQAGRAAAAARPHAGVHARHPEDDQVLRRGAGAAALRPLRRHDRLHARDPRQRSPCDRVREGGRARACIT